MPVSTSAVKVNPVTGALIDPPVATFAAANGLLTGGSSDAKDSVRAATTTNGTLATAFENGDTIDGITLVTGDRILIKNQSAPAENGIYVVAASGAPARATDFDAWTEIVGAFVSVEAGTVNAGTQWLCNVVAGGTLGVTAITFVVPKNFVDVTTAQNIGGLKTFTAGLNTTGATSEISTSGANAYIKTTGAYAAISTEGEYGGINTIGASASIQTSGLDATIFTTGANAHIFTYNSGAYIQTRSTFKLFGGTYTTTISHAATANRALALPDADGTLLSTADLGANVGTFLATPSGANLASALTSALPVSKGGTGVTTSGTTSEIPVGGGTGSAIVWTTATGTGAPVRAIAPAFTGAPTISGNTASPNGTITTIGDQLWSLHRVRQIGAFGFGNTGTSSVAAETAARGGANVNSGSSTSGYGRASIAHGLNQASASGGGIRFNYPISVAVVAGIHCGTATTSKARLVVGANGGVPATADANALAVVGFGVEFQYYASEQVECRLFAHNGTTYATSAWSGAVAGGLNRMTAFIVTSDGAGNIALYLSTASGVAGRPSSTALLTLAGGPTTQGNTTNNRIDFIATNDSTGSPSASIATLFSALLDTP